MYLTPFTTMTDHDEIVALVESVGVAQLVTSGPDGTPRASLLPILWDGGDRLLAHVSRANPQFHDLADATPALAVVTGPDAYIHPAWYPSTATSGRAVPTWNYLAVHLGGTLHLHDDPRWVRDAVARLSEHHARRHQPGWSLDGAPSAYLDGLLRGILGVELRVTSVEAKAKLSGNRTEADRRAVVEALAGEDAAGARAVSDAMARRLDPNATT